MQSSELLYVNALISLYLYALVSLFTYLNHFYVYALLCIFVHLSEPFVYLCANLNHLYVCISVNLCIFFHSSEPSVSLCICLDHFFLSPVSTSTCAVPFWVVSNCSYNPVFWFSAAFLCSFCKCASQFPSCLYEMSGRYIYSVCTLIPCLL